MEQFTRIGSSTPLVAHTPAPTVAALATRRLPSLDSEPPRREPVRDSGGLFFQRQLVPASHLLPPGRAAREGAAVYAVTAPRRQLRPALRGKEGRRVCVGSHAAAGADRPRRAALDRPSADKAALPPSVSGSRPLRVTNGAIRARHGPRGSGATPQIQPPVTNQLSSTD
ncbi:hypothetical protein SVAN01_11079 [Stagonosporopsis vannaccii]|nr:hypothetical protein SVAN01_11079 [Stagonosporopsis vannaccii]